MIASLRSLLERAGQVLVQHQQAGPVSAQTKIDASPLTQADLDSQEIILEGLQKLTSDLVVSEEMEEPRGDFSKSRFWLIDPLDGTRDFIAGKTSYVINVALVENGRPILGLVHAPAFGKTYWAEEGQGAFCNGERIFNHSQRNELIAVASGAHPSSRALQFIEKFNIQQVLRYGSALKLCHLAEGTADVYPRFGHTREWDTAAGHILLNEAGCKLIDMLTQKELIYGKPGFLNPGFMASRKDLNLLSETDL